MKKSDFVSPWPIDFLSRNPLILYRIYGDLLSLSTGTAAGERAGERAQARVHMQHDARGPNSVVRCGLAAGGAQHCRGSMQVVFCLFIF